MIKKNKILNQKNILMKSLIGIYVNLRIKNHFHIIYQKVILIIYFLNFSLIHSYLIVKIISKISIFA